jgi:MFS family permease
MKNRLTIVQVLNTFGNAITWTGLPVYAFFLTKSYLFTSILFFASSIASIFINLVGGYLIDRYSKKKLAMIGLTINFLICFLIYLCVITKMYFILFPLMIILQLSGGLSIASLNIWFNYSVPKKDLVKEMSQKGSWIMVARTIGFSFGPLLYGQLHIYAIFIDAFTFLLSVILIFNFYYQKPQGNIEKKSESIFSLISTFKEIWNVNILRKYWSIYLLRGLTEIIIINISIFILNQRFQATSIELSSFWFIGGVGGILIGMLMSKINLNSIPKYVLFLFCIVFSIGGILIMTFSSLISIYILGYLLTTFGNPLLNILLRAELFTNSPENMKGKTNGIMDATLSIGNLSMLSLSAGVVMTKGAFYLLLFVSILALAKITLFFGIYRKENNVLTQEEIM